MTRRRECLACGSRWTTTEILNEEYHRLMRLQVVARKFVGELGRASPEADGTAGRQPESAPRSLIRVTVV